MKKALAVLLAAVLITVLPAAPASAARFTSLSLLQRFLEISTPDLLARSPVSVEISGLVTDLHWCGENNHYQFTLQVEDPDARHPIGAEGPQLAVHFRLHLDEPPFRQGDTVTVRGTINGYYSSVMVPWILMESVNGSDDF